MPGEDTTPTPSTQPPGGDEPVGHDLVQRAGVLTHDGYSVGQYDAEQGVLVLNLGWCRLAGLGLVVEDDPRRDNHRSGISLARFVGNQSIEGVEETA